MDDTTGMRPAGAGDILACGFGITAAQWAVGYFCRLPGLSVPTVIVLTLMVVCLLGGGVLAGRRSPRGWKAGIFVGLVNALLNLMILGSLLNPGEDPNGIAASAFLWVPGSIATAIGLCTLGAAAGAATRRGEIAPRNWTAAFVTVACFATLLLLTVGGMVTGYEEGLSVVDWPNSKGHNMFLYPLSMMTGGIYYEHSHRLIGSLVGLTTMVLAFHLLRAERRRWLKTYAFIALAVVIVQGILGGLRVTGHFTLSTSREEVAPSVTLAIVHGVLGQLFFASLVAMRAFVSDTWKSDVPATRKLTAASDRSLGVMLVALLMVQLVLGAVLRHIAGGLHLHITVAVLVVALAATCGARAWGLNSEISVLARLGKALLVLISMQVTLGIAALAVTGFTARAGAPSTADVVVTGAHQIVGALLLAGAVLLTVYDYRLLAPVAGGQPGLTRAAQS